MAKDNIPKSKIPEALDALRALGAKELDDIPARAAIKKMRRQIERVLRLGYSYEEVSKTLAPLDINISPERIRYLLNDIRRSTRKKSSSPSEENTSTQVIDEPALDENSAIEQSSSQSHQKSESKSEPKSEPESKPESKPASSKSTTSKTPKTAKKTSDVKASENQNSSRPAFVPEIISDEDL